ncbi:PBSX family phage terminase large subunit [Bacteroides fragilis]|uniref:PBSX family phage terminase large subunit n=1 Tax=Bacteroides fragilis TaxID=817 RepID=UPI0004B58F01|nr:phage terminase large subunit [Bacteroides fragilis]
MDTTNVFSKNLATYISSGVRTIVNKGGTRSSKTWSILQLLYIIARESKIPRTISVVSETMPHLKRGCIKDFRKMLELDGLWDDSAWNATDFKYRVGQSTIEFFSADTPGKVTGPAREILYINECINVPFDIYRQLSSRTGEKIILDYNPLYEFWVDSKVLPREDTVLIHSTYKDNDMLPAAQIAEIEYQGSIDDNYYRVMILGETGSYEGMIIKNWDIVPRLPPRDTWKKHWIGVDFGWSAPTAIMLVVQGEGGEVWIDEIAYSLNMDNPDIAAAVRAAGFTDTEVICDKAEPKSIRELKNMGINAVPSDNKDIDLGIKVMNRYKKHYTQRSLNSIDENRKYRYSQDLDGNYTGKPIDKFNHAKDAERYVFLNRLSNISSGFDVTVGTAARR